MFQAQIEMLQTKHNLDFWVTYGRTWEKLNVLPLHAPLDVHGLRCTHLYAHPTVHGVGAHALKGKKKTTSVEHVHRFKSSKPVDSKAFIVTLSISKFASPT